MTLSYKTLLVIFAGLFGFFLVSVSFAYDPLQPESCSDGNIPEYYYNVDGGEYVFSSASDAANKHFVDNYSESQVSYNYTRVYEYQNVLSVTANRITYSYQSHYVIHSNGSTENYSDHVGVVNYAGRCVDNPCTSLEGSEASFTTMDLYSIAGCVGGCLVSSVGGGRVQVQFENGDGTVYTSGNYTGGSCSGSESDYSKVVDADNPPYKMELIDGVPTFTSNGEQIKLASDNTGQPDNLTNSINQLNPDKALDVKNSSGSTGLDGSTEITAADTTIQVTNVNNTTNTSSSGYQLSWDSGNISGTGDGTGTGEGNGTDTGGTGGSGDTVVNVDLSGVETKLDGIQSTLDGLGSDVAFAGDGDAGTFGGLTDTFMTEIKGSGLMQAASSITFPSGSGSCPVFSMSLLGGSVATTMHCEIWDSVKGALGVIMLFVYAVFGIRTIMSA